MITTTQPAAVADPASSHRDDPGTPHNGREGQVENGTGEPGSADAEPPEPAGRWDLIPNEPRPSGSGGSNFDASDADRSLTVAARHAHEYRIDSGIEFSIDAAEDVDHEIDFCWLDHRLRAAAAHLRRPIARVSIRIVGDLEMTDLNRRFHDADDTTDVLTFHSPTPQEGAVIEADIALCADEASRQTTSRGHGIERELLLYALHGLLHCCGYDDTDDESFAAMHAEEDRILNAIGVGSTFADGADDAAMREHSS